MQTQKTLRDLLVQKLQALFYIEHSLVEALPKMAEAATDEDLKKAFRDHLAETRNHVCRIEDAFRCLNESPEKLECAGIDGIIKDAGWVINTIGGPHALDANLSAAARYAEHYEMAGYLSAVKWAIELGESETATILKQNLAEEEKADSLLSAISSKVDPLIV